jgi:UDP-glucose 4-epimerase
MSEIMLRDASFAHGLGHVILRYFNVAGADPSCAPGSPPRRNASDQGRGRDRARPARKMDVFGTDYPTPDGTCVRDYIHVSDLAQAHLDALRYLRKGGASVTANCGYGRGYSVREVIDTVKQVSGVDFRVDLAPRAPGDPRRSSPPPIARARCSAGSRSAIDPATIVRHALGWERKLMLRNR